MRQSEKLVDTNQGHIQQNTADIEQNRNDILANRNRPVFTPNQAQRDLLDSLLEQHVAGAITYTRPFTRVTRWLVSTGLSLDTDGITINTTQRRALYGLGERMDKIYYFRTVTAAEHMGYLVRNGGDQVWFGVDPTTNVWQMYNPDEGVGLEAGRLNITHPDHPNAACLMLLATSWDTNPNSLTMGI